MKKFIVSAIYTSPPDSMGGNTKILIELLNNIKTDYSIDILTTEPLTFKKNVPDYADYNIEIIEVDNNKKSFSFIQQPFIIFAIFKIFDEHLKKYENYNDVVYVYSASDFAPDVVQFYLLSKKYAIRWIASLFLFIPNPFENLINMYKFPFFKYIIYFFYQRALFFMMLARADKFLITNKSDFSYFPKDCLNKVFPVYGGVNIEQLVETANLSKPAYQAVYCGRVHPQKGCDKLLKIWSYVAKKIPNAKLAIIGNGDEKYMSYLKELEGILHLKNNIEWLGYVNGIEKFKVYSQSKIFLHTTVYDNNGMVAAEALCSGLPVVMFDLEKLKEVYTVGCVKIPKYNIDKFALEVVNLLDNNDYYRSIKPNQAQINDIRAQWSWDARISKLRDFIEDAE